jgi:hypothetical protein
MSSPISFSLMNFSAFPGLFPASPAQAPLNADYQKGPVLFLTSTDPKLTCFKQHCEYSTAGIKHPPSKHRPIHKGQ